MRQPVDKWQLDKDGKTIYRQFGRNRRGLPYPEGFHVGYDYGCPIGEPVFAITDGEVIFCRTDIGGFGGLYPNRPGGCVMIKHELDGKAFISLYGHILIADTIGTGLIVKKGQQIGTIANFISNKDSLPHLHFGIYYSNKIPPNDTSRGIGWGYVKDEKDMKGWVDPLTFISNANRGC